MNNPLRPLRPAGLGDEALNGGLNLSILDGWWDEWYDGKNGWAIPTADGVDDPNHRDDLEAAALYDLIENSVASRFYDRDPRGLPTRWLEMVRHTITSLGPKVLATRMVSDYVQQLYVPSARAGRRVDAEAAQDLAAYRARSGMVDGQVDHESGVADSAQVGDEIQIRAFVTLGELRPEEVEVQVVYGRVTPADVLMDSSSQVLHLADSYEAGRFRYEGVIRLHRTGPFGYTVRVLPRHELMATPAEFGLVVNA